MILPIFISLVFGVVCGGEVEPSKCNECYLKHYARKGCTPVHEKGSDCPVRFDCPEKKLDDPSVCLFNGKTYKEGEKLDTRNPCLEECACRKGYGDKAKVDCPFLSCGLPINFNETCYRAFKEDKCCNYLHCPDEASQKIVCDYEGKKYRYGEAVDVGPDKICICNERWSGPEGASCRELGCFLLDKSERDLHSGCIPIYYEDICCPVELLCGEHTKVTTKSLATKEDIDSGNTCIFKDTHYKKGQTLEYEGKNSCVTCSCDAGPDFTCVQRKCPDPPTKGQCKREYVKGQCCPNWSCVL